MTEPHVGMPVTIVLYSDTVPGKVVKINPKSIVVQEVEWDENNGHRTNPDEPIPCWIYPAKMDSPRGGEKRYMKKGERWQNGSIRLVLGTAYRKVDYRY